MFKPCGTENPVCRFIANVAVCLRILLTGGIGGGLVRVNQVFLLFFMFLSQKKG